MLNERNILLYQAKLELVVRQVLI